MSDVNFYQQIEQMLGFKTNTPVNATSATEQSGSTTQTEQSASASSVSKSQIENDAKRAIWPGSAPLLSVPNYLELIIRTTQNLDEAKHQIISGMLDKWSESLKLMEDEDRKKFETRLKLGLDKLFSAFIIPTTGAPVSIQDVYKLESQRLDSQQNGAQEPLSFLGLGMSVLMINALTIIAGPSVCALNVAQPGMQLINELSKTDAVPKQLDASLKPDLLNQLAALLLLPSFYPAMAQATALMQLEPKANLEQVFASQFLKQNILIAKSADFTEFLKMMSSCIPTAAQAGTKQQELLLFTAKMMLLLSSLALFYKVETGGLTGVELKGMVTGEMILPENDPRKEAIALIHALLQSVKLPDKETSVMMEAFFKYFDGDPNYADLLNPLETMKTLNQNLSIPQNTLKAI